MNGAGQVGGVSVFFKRNPGAGGGSVAWGGCGAISRDRRLHSMPEHDTYQLRPRAARSREPRTRRTPQPLSKYRRKTANARERSRMREINRAFEALRRAVPAAAITGAPVPCEKLTKITTLRLAMRYISALSATLRESSPEGDSTPRPERWPSPYCSDLSEFSTEQDQELETTSEFAEDSLSPFDSFLAEFDYDYIDRTFA
ncbi:twist-related protein-like [Plodia interpunctella]|uniref:twist-related protein-like n=1 Tax=Plodia interpunctella TaxID=58824 RepID=UPI002367F770|nr:twist-related protein-like [Plodia interpunctella]